MTTRAPRLCWLNRRLRGFTLVELLTVVAILGILAAILVPTVQGARVSANRAKTRAQFSQWAAAFEQFRQEYGTYPQLYPDGAQKLVNQGATNQVGGTHLFHDLLAGARRDGSALNEAVTGTPPSAAGQNPRRLRFVAFSDAEFVTATDVAAGRAAATDENLIRDAFYNTSIAVIADTNLDGVINGRDTPDGFPAVRVAGGTTTLRPTTVVTPGFTGGTRAGVLFYCAPPGAASEDDLILSWR